MHCAHTKCVDEIRMIAASRRFASILQSQPSPSLQQTWEMTRTLTKCIKSIIIMIIMIIITCYIPTKAEGGATNRTQLM